jgi:hypothetical protein
MQLSPTCRATLYRITWQYDNRSIAVFAQADSRDTARMLFKRVIALLVGCEPETLILQDLRSYQELVDYGVSEDEDLRIFETAWIKEDVSEWSTSPLLLSIEPTLIGKLAELQAELAAADTCEAIGRARDRMSGT